MRRGKKYKNCDGCIYASDIGGWFQGDQTNRMCRFAISGHSAILKRQTEFGTMKLDLRGPDLDKCLLKDTSSVREIPLMEDEKYEAIIELAISKWDSEYAKGEEL
ncbi:MAG: hypothetical protein IIZ78_28550 [Clostridiales bacterium]|nr:hypothetical protein [Clostridiales bacterium]